VTKSDLPTPFVFRDARHPFEVVFFFAATLAGSGGVLTSGSTALSRLLPHWQVVSWNVALVAGGVVGLSSLPMRFPGSLLVERVSMILFAGLLLIQGIAIATQLTLAATGVMMLGFAVACLVRAIQITRDLRTLHHFLVSAQ
jgi:hypothetical protein